MLLMITWQDGITPSYHNEPKFGCSDGIGCRRIILQLACYVQTYLHILHSHTLARDDHVHVCALSRGDIHCNEHVMHFAHSL